MTATLASLPVDTDVSSQPAALAYEGTVVHHRRDAPRRRFTPRLFLAYLDVDALPGCARPDAALVGAPVRSGSLSADATSSTAATDRSATRCATSWTSGLGRRPNGRGVPARAPAHVRLAAQPARGLLLLVAGAATELDALVLEVTNTPWGERQWYVFDARHGRTTARTPKAMHVSPFLPMDVEYRVSWTAPGADLHLRIEVERAGKQLFFAALALRRVHLDRRHAVALLARYPLLDRCASRRRSTARPSRCSLRQGSAVSPSGGRHHDRFHRPHGRRAAPRSTPGRYARARRCCGCRTIRERARSPEWHAVARAGDRARPAPLRTAPPRGERRTRRVVRRRLVGHRRPSGIPAARAPQPRPHARAARLGLHRIGAPGRRPVVRRRAADRARDKRQRPRALRPRQRSVPAPARRDDDVFLRGLRRADRLARDGVACQARPARVDHAAGAREIGSWRSAAGGAGSRSMPRSTYGCHVTTTTISEEQYEYAQARVRAAGLEAPRHRARRSLPRPRGHVRQGDRDRDDRGRRLARVRHVLRARAAACSPIRVCS